MTHDEAFAAHRARREEERARTVKVTWRKVSELTGGGWSGLGPDGRLVRVVGPSGPLGFYSYYELVEGRPHLGGGCPTLARAKRAAAAMFNEAPKAQKERTMTDQNIPTAESLMEGIGEAVRADKAAYARLRANGRTLGYADTRTDGFVLNVSSKAVLKAPAKFINVLEVKGDRRTLRVTTKNQKTARALVEWLAKQV